MKKFLISVTLAILSVVTSFESKADEIYVVYCFTEGGDLGATWLTWNPSVAREVCGAMGGEAVIQK